LSVTNVCVCTQATGSARYFLAARQCLLSILEKTDFEIFAAASEGPWRLLPRHRRIRLHAVPSTEPRRHRSQPFLQKFWTLRECLAATDAKYLLLLDVDTLIAARITLDLLRRSLAGSPLGMVEQTGIKGSDMSRKQFLDHYRRHTLVWLGQGVAAPTLKEFRFFNSGVVLGRREEFENLTNWALVTMAAKGPQHQVGEHMIADQDYFQYWTNSLHRGSCRELSWRWNHCRHWDDDFPNRSAYIFHFSNFCQGPSWRTLLEAIRVRGRTPA
jgi:hypothetical protein